MPNPITVVPGSIPKIIFSEIIASKIGTFSVFNEKSIDNGFYIMFKILIPLNKNDYEKCI